MGLLIDGIWQDDSQDKKRFEGGRFVRPSSPFRNWVTPDGSPGPEGEGGFAAEPGRYHLYISYACPWAHRAVILRRLKGLRDVISMSAVSYGDMSEGWTFDRDTGSNGDPVNNVEKLHQIYTLADPKFTGRVTVPVLWDRQTKTIVNNESSEIIRMFNSSFDAFTDVKTDYYPAEQRRDIDTVNDEVYPNVNNGVYRAGFAISQDAYEEAVRTLFDTLASLERRLSKRRYIVGARQTEADWRLFTTLIRFDAVYHGHFKCNLWRLADYENLSNYLRDLYQTEGVADTVNFTHIKRHYYGTQLQVNPTGIVPLGPELDFTGPHDRERFIS